MDGEKRRFLSLFLPHWPADCWHRQKAHRKAWRNQQPSAQQVDTAPLLLVRSSGNLRLVHAADDIALARGLFPGQRLADALACVPEARVEPADPEGDLGRLHRLAQWATRFTPYAAPDAPDGLMLDITGCGHLWGGEDKLMADALMRLARQGFAARGAIAGTIGAAWASARFGGAKSDNGRSVIPPGSIGAALHTLPVRALRLDEAIAAGLERLGLRRIGDLYPLPRAELAKRFGGLLLNRLDQALGYVAESLSPLAPTPDYRVSLIFAEPISAPESLARASELLLGKLLSELAAQELGVRRLGLVAHRLDDEAPGLIIGTAHPSRDVKHLSRLIAEKLETIDPGPGIERMSLSALVAEKMKTIQADFDRRSHQMAEADLAPLVDRLANRLGAGSVTVPRAIASHMPERAVAFVPPLQKKQPTGDWSADLPPRPIRLLSPPEPIEALAPVPDDPPLSFRWRHVQHRVAKAEGPERIRPEWWQQMDDGKETRDYYRVEIEDGRRFWLFRSGLYAQDTTRPPRWFLHGIFA